MVGERLRTQGATIAIKYRSRPEEAAEAVRAVEQAGGLARAFQGDVADVGVIRGLFENVDCARGGLDILVANAGLPFIGVPVADVSDADFDRIAAGSPLGRIGEPGEVPNVIAFLSTEQVRWITG